MLVLIANDPRAYREAISGTLEALRPGFEVLMVEPGNLDEEVLRMAPHLVVCSRVSNIIEERAPVWIELYPGHSSGAVVQIADERTAIPEMDFETLLSTVDRAGLLYELV